jgi:hypothetical protein
MSGIKTIDLLLITDLFEPKGSAGYILNFNDRTFAQFFAQELPVDIDDPAYAKNGTSKGKRLRYFLQAVDDPMRCSLWLAEGSSCSVRSLRLAASRNVSDRSRSWPFWRVGQGQERCGTHRFQRSRSITVPRRNGVRHRSPHLPLPWNWSCYPNAL